MKIKKGKDRKKIFQGSLQLFPLEQIPPQQPLRTSSFRPDNDIITFFYFRFLNTNQLLKY